MRRGPPTWDSKKRDRDVRKNKDETNRRKRKGKKREMERASHRDEERSENMPQQAVTELSTTTSLRTRLLPEMATSVPEDQLM